MPCDLQRGSLFAKVYSVRLKLRKQLVTQIATSTMFESATFSSFFSSVVVPFILHLTAQSELCLLLKRKNARNMCFRIFEEVALKPCHVLYMPDADKMICFVPCCKYVIDCSLLFYGGFKVQ